MSPLPNRIFGRESPVRISSSGTCHHQFRTTPPRPTGNGFRYRSSHERKTVLLLPRSLRVGSKNSNEHPDGSIAIPGFHEQTTSEKFRESELTTPPQ